MQYGVISRKPPTLPSVSLVTDVAMLEPWPTSCNMGCTLNNVTNIEIKDYIESSHMYKLVGEFQQLQWCGVYGISIRLNVKIIS